MGLLDYLMIGLDIGGTMIGAAFQNELQQRAMEWNRAITQQLMPGWLNLMARGGDIYDTSARAALGHLAGVQQAALFGGAVPLGGAEAFAAAAGAGPLIPTGYPSLINALGAASASQPQVKIGRVPAPSIGEAIQPGVTGVGPKASGRAKVRKGGGAARVRKDGGGPQGAGAQQPATMGVIPQEYSAFGRVGAVMNILERLGSQARGLIRESFRPAEGRAIQSAASSGLLASTLGPSAMLGVARERGKAMAALEEQLRGERARAFERLTADLINQVLSQGGAMAEQLGRVGLGRIALEMDTMAQLQNLMLGQKAQEPGFFNPGDIFRSAAQTIRDYQAIQAQREQAEAIRDAANKNLLGSLFGSAMPDVSIGLPKPV